ncbi:CRISPR-associated RAMP Cmr4 [Thermococcus sp. 2319x1]|uniref:type III-B CRISPR module RAMP protein Cmr4 n=1 Tax=Thermococcus sp. 2319x1 TaxID=1674923 RepID=UPI00073A8917|nr:type III-B CRISPR module RAMP protein Cmr4 [Thermococcus sp. 2319x1]ALV63531.1 CRISPR-associated RAMP Cmr4 [Thermococcus sp. 2319x1]
MVYEKKLVLGIYAVTPVHAGSGSEVGLIDLPIQRERHTGFPVIWGQSLKGVLRSAFKKENSKSGIIYSIFGPDTERASEHAGAISVGDAKILLFPVRSAKGVFAYVTCPLVLERFKRDLELAGKNTNFIIPTVGGNEAVVSKNSVLMINGNVVLEEVVLKGTQNDLSGVVNAINHVLPDGVNVEERLAVVPDDVFSAFVRMSTEIVARVAINAETGTVKQGGLWYEEFLPADTVLYSVIAIAKPRGGELKTAEEVSNILENFFKNNRFLQIGGDETIGKGFVKIKISGGEGNESENP